MKPEEREELAQLRDQVAELLAWKQARERQQFASPLDDQSTQILREAFRTTIIERLNVRDIFFQATQESPTENGQMRFFDDRSTQTMRICTTKGVFTGSIDLTAV